jgi:uncharacterized protein
MDSAKQFSSESYISLETYKKSGEAVRSPVWVVEEGGVVFVRTDPTSWKAKRIRKNQRVRVAPSDMRGKPTGSWVDGEAHFVEGEEAQRILKLFKKKYGITAWLIDSYHGLRGSRSLTVISIKLA